MRNSKIHISFAVLTISDRSAAGTREDVSGPLLQELIKKQGWEILDYRIIPDDIEAIKKSLEYLCNLNTIDLILTTGGTGFSSRDNTPEATQAVIEKETPGISECIRAESLKITPHAMLSRAISGIAKKTLIINFPGNPKAVEENFQIILPILPHAVDLIKDNTRPESSHQFKM